MINSREKGARFERRLAKIFREYGYDARRGQQYCGANGDADVIGLPGVHVEAKHVQKLNLLNAMSQSKHDAKPGEIPVVMHAKNYTGVFVTLMIGDFMEIFREYEAGRSEG